MALASIAIAACGDDNDVSEQPTTTLIDPQQLQEMLDRANRFRLADILDVDLDVDLAEVSEAEAATILDRPRLRLTCVDWDLEFDDEGVVSTCLKWDWRETQLLTITCSTCPDELRTAIPLPDDPLFRPIDMSNPAEFWNDAGSLDRLRLLSHSLTVDQQRSAPAGLDDYLAALKTLRPQVLTAEQRLLDNQLRAVRVLARVF